MVALLAGCDHPTKPEPGSQLPHAALTLYSQATDTVHGRVVGFRGSVDTSASVYFAVGSDAEQLAQTYPPDPSTGLIWFQGEANPLANGKSWVFVRARVAGAVVATDSFSVVVDVPQRHYSAVVIDTAGSVDVQGLYLANDGRLAGNWYTLPDASRAFTWKSGAFVALDSMRKVTGLNNVGQVLGWTGPAALTSETMIWQNGTYQIASGFTGGVAISDQGRVVRTLTSGYWENGVIVNYTAPPTTGPLSVFSINNNGMIAGGRINATQAPTPVIWTTPTTWIAPGLSSSVWLPAYRVYPAFRIGDGGHALMTASFYQLTGEVPGFLTTRSLLYFDGQTEDLNAVVGFNASAASVNATGVVAGTYLDGAEVRAFTWAGGRTTDVVLDTPGWTIENIYSINDQGQLSARAYNASNHRVALILTPVP